MDSVENNKYDGIPVYRDMLVRDVYLKPIVVKDGLLVPTVFINSLGAHPNYMMISKDIIKELLDLVKDENDEV